MIQRNIINTDVTKRVDYSIIDQNNRYSKKTRNSEFSDLIKSATENKKSFDSESASTAKDICCKEANINENDNIDVYHVLDQSRTTNIMNELTLLLSNWLQLQQNMSDTSTESINTLMLDTNYPINSLNGINLIESMTGSDNNNINNLGELFTLSNTQTDALQQLLYNMKTSENSDLLNSISGNKELAVAFSDLLKSSVLINNSGLINNKNLMIGMLPDIIYKQPGLENIINGLYSNDQEQINNNLSLLSSINSIIKTEDSYTQIMNDSILYSELKDLLINDNSISELADMSENGKEILNTGKSNDNGLKLEQILSVSSGTENLSTENVSISYETINKLNGINELAQKNVLNQVKEQIVLMRDKGIDTVTMKLNPENLGKLDIKMVFEKGILNVEITASNPKTQSLLIANSEEIKSILENTQDRAIINFNNDKELPDNYDSNQNRNNQHEQQNNNEEKNNNYQHDNEKSIMAGIDFFDELVYLKKSINYS